MGGEVGAGGDVDKFGVEGGSGAFAVGAAISVCSIPIRWVGAMKGII